MKIVGRTLPGRPELVHVGRHFDARTRKRSRVCPNALSGFAEFAEGKQLFRQRAFQPCFVGRRNGKGEFHVLFQIHRMEKRERFARAAIALSREQ